MLFDEKPYDGDLYDGGNVLAEVFSNDAIVFDGFSLNDGTSVVAREIRISGPSREFLEGSIPRGDGKFLTDDRFREYVIEVEGRIRADTAAELDALIDTMKKRLRKRERPLDYTPANGAVRRFTATLANFDTLFAGREHYHVTFHPFLARFVDKGPFPKSRSYTSIMASLSTSPRNETVYVEGTKEAQPVVILIFSAASSVTAVAIANTTTGETITHTGSIVAGDWIEFDSENMRVRKNGTQVNFSGPFPSLDLGSNTFSFTVTGTSFAATATIKWKTRYL